MCNLGKPTLLIVSLLALLISNSLFASGDKTANKLIRKGDNEFNKSHLQKAQGYYLQALAIDSTDSYANFQVGAIYYLSDSFKVKALPYFLNTIKFSGPGEDDTIIDAYYYIGNCYALLKNYGAAVIALNKYIEHIDPKSRVDETLLKEVKHTIEICSDAPVLVSRSADSSGYLLDNKFHAVYVKNLGGTINSPYPEYAQVLLNHDSTIIFTSRRPTSQQGKKDFMTDQYYEDIFISHKDSGHWQTPSVFSNQLHLSSSEDNLASVTITSDGHTLFIYHDGRVWESHNNKGVWSKPEKIGKNIRQINRYVPSVFVSNDGNKLFLVSDKPGGYGGKDIYESDKNSDGTWSQPQNLGPNVNTSFDEDAPFLLPDNKTLFFSSKGHPGLGGYDIFKSVYENGQWSKAVNLGSPVNSSADDIYFTYDTTLQEGFFSSSRVGGYGNMDIYSFSFICDNIENTIVQGKIASEGKANATITFTDIKNHKTFKGQSDANGNYSISIKPESTYNVQIKLPGYLPFYTSLSTPHQCDAYNLYQVINASFVTDSLYVHAGQTLSVKNAFYRHIKQGDYKNAKQDSQLSALIGSYNDTASIWERDTNVAITYTPAQRDSLNPKKAIAINMDTAQAITAPEIASAKTAPVKSNGKAQKNGKVIAANIDTTGKAANPALAGTKTKVAPLKIVSSPALPKLPVVYFGFNKYSIAAEYHPMLDSLAIYAKANGKYRIQIEGNTDTVGSVAYNKRLSLLRAKAVADYLERKGIAAKRIHTEGNGKRHLAVVGDGTNARNRRSDILIIE